MSILNNNEVIRKTIPILLTTLLFSQAILANEGVSSLGQAVSLCRAEAMTVNDDFVRSKSTRMKETRSGYNIKLKVYLSETSVISTCNIQRDGTLAYSQE